MFQSCANFEHMEKIQIQYHTVAYFIISNWTIIIIIIIIIMTIIIIIYIYRERERERPSSQIGPRIVSPVTTGDPVTKPAMALGPG